MKNILLVMLFLSSTMTSFAQATVDDARNQLNHVIDSLEVSPEGKDFAFAVAEMILLHRVDSVIEEGRYLQALTVLDSIQVYWKKLTDKDPSVSMYARKGTILMTLEEWQPLLTMCDECLRIHKESLTNKEGGLVYSMQGYAYRNIEKYLEAVKSYESAILYYTKDDNIGSVADMTCNMAYCYGKLSKYSTTSNLYEKGIAKFLEYYNITRSRLLAGEFKVADSYKKSVLGVFSAHLLDFAIFEEKIGNKQASKEYLLMSAHCGNDIAKREYQRIYGY